MNPTMIIVNIIMSMLAAGILGSVVVLALRLNHGYPPRWGRASGRGPTPQRVSYRAASMATAVNSRAR